MDKTYDLLVVGAGASGLAAAVEASRAGASVLVLEKNHVPGRKVLSTGAGKCNFSNLKVTPARFHPPSSAFLKKAFAALPPAEVPAFFAGLGLLYADAGDGRLFPRSQKAQDVVSALANELGARGAELRTLTEVRALRRAGDFFEAEAAAVLPKWDKRPAPEGRQVFRGRRALLAAGGPCYPQIGGTSAGAALLRELGHTVSELAPVLVPLKVGEDLVKELDGVRAQAALTLLAGGKAAASSEGELLFTAYGLSGPAALDLSRAALDALRRGEARVLADLFPDIPAPKFRRLLEARAAAFSARPFHHFCCGLANEKVCKAAARLAGINMAMSAGLVGKEQLAAFGGALKAMTFGLTGTLGFEDAMVTAGGCSLAEIDPETFASKKVPGLFVTGELLDLDGDSGGFNLHLAWTSGILAGRAAASYARAAGKEKGRFRGPFHSGDRG